jgi:hypothetical protein
MLEPQTRAALTEQLAPPPGFELSHAVGTTFTLDLETALTIPLSFASHRLTAADGDLGVLDAIRRASDRIDVFAQAGAITMGGRTDLVAFLERLVHPVTVPRGLFHPKVWFLEYAQGEERAYRFLCASRNLTDDRSWDVLVRLDGRVAAPAQRAAARTRNAPLVDLLRRLPGWAVNPLADDRRARISALGAAFETVEWELPEGFGELSFHVLGVPKGGLPELRGKNALIISPFVSGPGLAELRDRVDADTVLISRPESLDRLEREALDPKLQTWVLDDAANLPDDDDGSTGLSGLHAKVIIVDRQAGARILIGSANATGAALRHNVEVMVGFVAGYKTYGVRPTMAALETLLESYPTEGGKEPSEREQTERQLEEVLRHLGQARLSVRIVPGDPFALEVWADEIARDRADGIDVRWHLLTRDDLGDRGLPPDPSTPHVFEGLPLTDISPFLVLVARAGDLARRTIVLARLLDDVDTRRDAILASRVTDPATFIRLLMLLLELSGQELPGGADTTGFFGTGAAGGVEGAGLFESLVRAVGVGHQGLADVRRIVDYLQSTGDDDVLPQGFAELWSAVWTAHERLSPRIGSSAAEAAS